MDRYRKQVLFHGVGASGQAALEQSRCAVIGCGALGSHLAETMVRAGVGLVRIVDRDFVEISNLQRQTLFTEADVVERLPKAVAAARRLQAINSTVAVEPIVADVTPDQILNIVRDCHVILDGTDNFETRFLINDAALELCIPWVHAGVVGGQGQVMAIIPGQSPCFRCLMPEPPGPGGGETCDTVGVISPAVQMAAAIQAALTLRILMGQAAELPAELHVFDVWNPSQRAFALAGLKEHPCRACRTGERLWLHGDAGAQSTVLCGRNSVQVTPASRMEQSLGAAELRLAPLGDVRANPFLLVFEPIDSDCSLTLFADGRAIISGTEDPSVARSLYARYLGQ